MRADLIVKKLKESKDVDLTEGQYALAHFLLASALELPKSEGVQVGSPRIVAKSFLNGDREAFAKKMSPDVVQYRDGFVEKDVSNVYEALVKAGYLACTYYFNDHKNDYYELNNEFCDEPELDIALAELEKSKAASIKYGVNPHIFGSNNIDYDKERGSIVNPHTGETGEDPLTTISTLMSWTGNVGFDSHYVLPSDEDELSAYREILPENLKAVFRALAKQKAIKRVTKA